MIILTDVDDCLLDWISGFKEYVTTRGIKVRSEQPLNWNLEHWVDASQVGILVQEFNRSKEFEKLSTLPGALHAVDTLTDRGFELVAITSCGEYFETIQARQRNLLNCFGSAFKTIHCLGLKDHKHEVLSRYEPTWWIEDKLENAMIGQEIGHKAILMDRAHNQGPTPDGVARCKNWVEIVDLITSSLV